ncbi:MAG: hypothetical protein ACYCO4_00075 [Sulfobacillus sp.]
MPLTLHSSILLPAGSDFDHADVHLPSGLLVVAHTDPGSVEIVDTLAGCHLTTLAGCPDASGVVVAAPKTFAFAAARASGDILKIDLTERSEVGRLTVGEAPNGLAYDSSRDQLLVADVRLNTATLIDSATMAAVASCPLPGRPRWCLYEAGRDRFLVNIREPALLAVLAAGVDALAISSLWPLDADGPHGLAIDPDQDLAFVAADDGNVVSISLDDGRERGRCQIPGAPDVVFFNPLWSELYVAIGDPGLLVTIDTQQMRVSETTATALGAHTFAFDPDRQRLYSLWPDLHQVVVFATQEVPA